MNTLERIIAHKRKETEERKALYPISALENCPFFDTQGRSLLQALIKSDNGIIAEFKRQSPSKGIINNTAQIEQVTQDYQSAGVAGISVLTDLKFFTGTGDDMLKTTVLNNVPILRKDFIIDEFQVIESKAIGSDVILLIAEALSKDEVHQLSQLANEIGLEVLLEVHSAEQLEKLGPHVNLLGVNNRNLKSFKVDVTTSFEIARQVDNHIPLISESGIDFPSTVIELREHGFSGFLIGQAFMQDDDPGNACHQFVKQVQKLMLQC